MALGGPWGALGESWGCLRRAGLVFHRVLIIYTKPPVLGAPVFSGDYPPTPKYTYLGGIRRILHHPGGPWGSLRRSWAVLKEVLGGPQGGLRGVLES